MWILLCIGLGLMVLKCFVNILGSGMASTRSFGEIYIRTRCFGLAFLFLKVFWVCKVVWLWSYWILFGLRVMFRCNLFEYVSVFKWLSVVVCVLFNLTFVSVIVELMNEWLYIVVYLFLCVWKIGILYVVFLLIGIFFLCEMMNFFWSVVAFFGKRSTRAF